jgi:hypothetical protein
MTWPDTILRIDTVDVIVDAPTISNIFTIPEDGDVVVICGYTYGGDLDEFRPYFVTSIENMLPRIDSDSAVAKTLLSCWNAGGRNVVIVKIGDETDLDGLSGYTRSKLMYDDMKQGLEVARGLWYAGIVVPAGVSYEGYRETVTGTTLTLSSGRWTHSDTKASIDSDVTAVYDTGANIGNEHWTQYYTDSDGITQKLSNGVIMIDYSPSGAITCDWIAKLDFVALLADECAKATQDDILLQGVIGTTSSDPTSLLASWTLTDKYGWQYRYCWTEGGGGGWLPFNDKYRFVSVAVGRAKFFLRGLDAAFESDLAGHVAGLMSSLPEDVAISGRVVSGVYPTVEPTKAQADLLSVAGLIPFGTTVARKRFGFPEIFPLSDQNLAIHTSDYQQNTILRLARRVTMLLKRRIDTIIGTRGTNLEDIIVEVLESFKERDVIKDYSYRIALSPTDPNKRLVFVELKSYFSVKVIRIAITTGRVAP